MSTAHVTYQGPILRADPYEHALKNKAYRRTPVGHQLGRYLDTLKWQGYPQTTRDSYETTYNRLALDHDDFDGLGAFCTPVGTEYLREFLARHWAEAAQATKAQRTSAVKSAFAWAADQGIIPWDPAAKLRAPKARGTSERQAYPQEVVDKLVSAQETLRDQCVVQLYGRLGLRKNEVRELRVGDIDTHRALITIRGKGNKLVVMPIGVPSLVTDLKLHIQAEERKADEYLLYPKRQRRKPMDPSGVHRWFKRALHRAGLPDTIKLHELRHTAADHLYRETGDIYMASRLLRHSSTKVTEGYLHPSREDLAHALEAVYGRAG